MFDGYSPYTKDRRKSEYTDYIREKAHVLGMLTINTREPVTIIANLQDTRSNQDYYRLIFYLQKCTCLDYDCIQYIIKLIKKNEPLSTREWYMGVYDLVRESKSPQVFCSWYQWRYVGERFYTPISIMQLDIKNSLHVTFKRYFNLNHFECVDKNETWINSPKEIDTYPKHYKDIIKYKQNSHYDRILNHTPIEKNAEYKWNKDSNGEWKRTKKNHIYTPYTIRWTEKHKWSQDFITKNRRKLTLRRLVLMNSSSKWIKIECGNRYYYQNSETSIKTRQLPQEGFSNIHICDIYFFDTEYPVLI